MNVSVFTRTMCASVLSDASKLMILQHHTMGIKYLPSHIHLGTWICHVAPSTRQLVLSCNFPLVSHRACVPCIAGCQFAPLPPQHCIIYTAENPCSQPKQWCHTASPIAVSWLCICSKALTLFGASSLQHEAYSSLAQQAADH